jgi:hypothetical protein
MIMKIVDNYKKLIEIQFKDIGNNDLYNQIINRLDGPNYSNDIKKLNSLRNDIIKLNKDALGIQDILLPYIDYKIHSINYEKNPVLLVKCENIDSIKNIYFFIYNKIKLVTDKLDNANSFDEDVKTISDRILWDERMLKEYIFCKIIKDISAEDLKRTVAEYIYYHIKSKSKMFKSLSEKFNTMQISSHIYNISDELFKNPLFYNTLLNNNKFLTHYYLETKLLAWQYGKSIYNKGNDENWFQAKDIIEYFSYKVNLYDSYINQNFDLEAEFSEIKNNLTNELGNILIEYSIKNILKIKLSALKSCRN